MRVAFITSMFPAVSETFILAQVTGLIDLGHQVDIYATRAGDGPVHGDVEKYHLPARTRYIRDFSTVKGRGERLARAVGILLPQVWRDPASVARWCGVVRAKGMYEALNLLFKLAPFWAGRYDVIHTHFGPTGGTWIWLKRFTRAPYVCAFYGYDISSYVETHGREVYRELFAEADAILALSEHMKLQLTALGCDPARVVVHRLGTDPARFAAPSRNGASGEPVEIVSVARLVEKKGLEYAIRAVAQVVQGGARLRYRIIGGGPLEPSLRRLINELGLAGTVELLGPQTSDVVTQAMGRADIFILPSVTAASGDQEGTPVSLMEAEAAGVPVVSTRHSAIPELVLDGESGFLAEERDVAGLAESLRRLAADPTLRRRFGARGRRLIEERHSLPKLNAALAALYGRLAARGTTGRGGV